MSPSTGSASPSHSQWHAVTPQTRPLSISILELAPTSVTLALTRSPPVSAPSAAALHLLPLPLIASSQAAEAHAHSHAHALGSSAAFPTGSHQGTGRKKKKKRHGAAVHHLHQQNVLADSEDDDGGDDEGSGFSATNALAVPGAYPPPLFEGQTLKDMLSHGVVVTLDGEPWSRIVAHVSDDEGDGDEDEDGEWEDAGEVASGAGAGEEGVAEEGMVNASGGNFTIQVARRRRGKRGGVRGGRGRSPRPMRVCDKGDRSHRWDRERAVVVVYDLDPSKEHEVELQIAGLTSQAPESMVSVSNTVLVSPASPSATLHPRSRANSLRSRSRPRSRSNSVNTSAAGAVSVGPSPLGYELETGPGSVEQLAAVPTAILSPQDTQTAQTRQAIAAAHVEREHLQVQIKEARKTAQRSEAALRTEIESMKRSNEKAGSSDQRNKQKFLALQEQVKQAWAGAETTNQQVDDVKAAVPELEARLAGVLADVEGVRGEWKLAKAHEDGVRDQDKKSRAEDDKRLADVSGRVDKLRSRRDKRELEHNELLKKVGDLERRREEVERKAEEEKTMRRQGYYPGGMRRDGAPGTGTAQGYGGSSGSGFRPRGGFTPRVASGGRPPAAATAAALPSPAVASFYQNPPSPAWTAPNPKSTPPRTTSTAPNPAAAPFLPSSFAVGGPNSTPAAGSSASAPFDPTLHTAFMPPPLQHRIYLPDSVRPRPTPNFHPPPSVLAEQQAQAQAHAAAQATTPPFPTAVGGSTNPATGPALPPLSTGPSFPPLGNLGPASTATAQTATGTGAAPPGPSLASIVTRAVLAPTSALAPPAASGSGRPRAELERDSRGGDFPPLPVSPPSRARATPPRTTTPAGM